MKYLIMLTFILFCLLDASEISAQCAMCRATVESSATTQNGAGKGLNTGILYLMTIPYLLIGTLGYLWYANSRKETDKQNRILGILKRKLT